MSYAAEMDWDDLPEQPTVLAATPTASDEAIVLNQGRGKSDQLEKIRSLEDELLSEALGVVRDVVNFDVLAPDAQAPPDAWVEELGYDAAWRKFRRTMAGWMNQKQAPVAVGIAGSFATKVIKARSLERAAPRSLAIVIMPAPAPAAALPFEVRDVED